MSPPPTLRFMVLSPLAGLKDPYATGQVQDDQPTTYSALTMEPCVSIMEQPLQEMGNNMSTIMSFIQSVSSQNNSSDPNPQPGGSLPSANPSASSDPMLSKSICMIDIL
eukprot:12064760-Ditylum_brightwellii.AAC.1